MQQNTERYFVGTRQQEQEAFDTDVLTEKHHHIVVWNDDVNTFDWVIESLMDICSHTAEQAEQCAMYIHFKGKYAVKKGNFDTLRPLCEGLIDRGLNATID